MLGDTRIISAQPGLVIHHILLSNQFGPVLVAIIFDGIKHAQNIHGFFLEDVAGIPFGWRAEYEA
jgi:hypothetical protein